MTGSVREVLIYYYLIGSLSTFLVSAAIYFLCYHRYRKVHSRLRSWCICLSLLLSAYLPVAQYCKYRSLHFYVDFSHWTQLLYAIASTGRPLSLNSEIITPGTGNYLSVHFVPFIYLLAAPFKLLPYSETLIALNFVLLISSVIPLYKLALLHQESKEFGWFMIAVFVAYPTFQYIVLYEFEMLRLSVPIMLWMLYFWHQKKIALYFVFACLAVLVREEVGLTILMFGIYLVLIEKNRRCGLATAILGLGAFAVITQIIMPGLSEMTSFQHIAAGTFSQLGTTPGMVIENVARRPGLLLSIVADPVKWANIGMLFLTLLFIPLFAPALLISIMANIGVGLISESVNHTSYMLYYVSPSIPFIFYSFIRGWPRINYWLARLTPKAFVERSSVDAKAAGTAAAMAAVLSGLLVTNVFFGPSPLSLQFWFENLRPAPFRTQSFHYSAYNITGRDAVVERMCDLIPDSAVVSAQQFLHPRLFRKRGAMVFPQLESLDGKIEANYVLIDKTNSDLRPRSSAYIPPGAFNQIDDDEEGWQLVASAESYFLYRRIRN